MAIKKGQPASTLTQAALGNYLGSINTQVNQATQAASQALGYPVGVPQAAYTISDITRKGTLPPPPAAAQVAQYAKAMGNFAAPSTPPTLAPERLVAYHHYADEGLQRIPVQLFWQSDGQCSDKRFVSAD